LILPYSASIAWRTGSKVPFGLTNPALTASADDTTVVTAKPEIEPDSLLKLLYSKTVGALRLAIIAACSDADNEELLNCQGAVGAKGGVDGGKKEIELGAGDEIEPGKGITGDEGEVNEPPCPTGADGEANPAGIPSGDGVGSIPVPCATGTTGSSRVKVLTVMRLVRGPVVPFAVSALSTSCGYV
jgi:hypothetical protein